MGNCQEIWLYWNSYRHRHNAKKNPPRHCSAPSQITSILWCHCTPCKNAERGWKYRPIFCLHTCLFVGRSFYDFEIQHMIFRCDFLNRLHRHFWKLVQLFMIVGQHGVFSWWYLNPCRLELFRAPPDLSPEYVSALPCSHSTFFGRPRQGLRNMHMSTNLFGKETTNICGQFAICFYMPNLKIWIANFENRTSKPIHRANSATKCTLPSISGGCVN